MELSRIRELLEKYYQGETTLKEEQELKAYLSKDIVPDEFKAEQATFRFLQLAGKNTMKPSLDIEPSLQHAKAHTSKRYIRSIVWTSVAACLMVGMSMFFFYQEENMNSKIQSSNQNLGTYDNPEEAYEEAKRALLLVSSKLNKGTDNMQKISKFHEAQASLTARNE